MKKLKHREGARRCAKMFVNQDNWNIRKRTVEGEGKVSLPEGELLEKIPPQQTKSQ